LIKYLFFSVLGIISLLVLLLVGFWAYYSFIKINNTIDSGEGYGFKIGASKIESYKIANLLIEQNEITGFQFVYPRETYDLIYSPQEISKVKEYFHRWDYWVLTDAKTPQSSRVDLGFENGSLTRLGKVGNGEFIPINNWPEGVPNGIEVIRIGDSQASVHEKLEAVQDNFPLARIKAANLSSYKLPNYALPDEYYLVEDYMSWDFRVNTSFFSNSITLFFDENDKLINIHRNRYAFELP
jgi:hypothetical protein